MYILENICYSEELKENIKVNNVKYLKSGLLLVTFSNGEQKILDRTKLVGSVFAPLADDDIFSNPIIFHGVITWKDGEIDIAPELVYRESYAYEKV